MGRPGQVRRGMGGLNLASADAEEQEMSDLVAGAQAGQRAGSLRPNRIAIWPVEPHGFGIDFTYHGATGYRDAEAAERALSDHGLRTTFRQELDGAWTVRFGPLPREHMRAVLDRFAW